MLYHIVFMNFSELAKKRYSCKKYDGRKISDEQLNYILEAGRLSLTAKNSQEQRIYVIRSEDAMTKIDAATPCRYNAGTVLVVAFDKNGAYSYPRSTRDSGVEDATIVATHMILAAADIGVDSCWVNNFNPEELKSALGLPENEEILMIMDLGFAAEGAGPLPNHSSRKDLSETVSYI